MAAMEGVPVRPGADLYDRDSERWAATEAGHLREGRHHPLDTANLVEEVESLGRGKDFAEA